MTERLRRLVLVRHGETVGQSSIRYFGATDLALSEAGLQQMCSVGRALREESFDLVLTSAMQRTVTAARLIVPEATPQAVEGFNEINFGAWEGLTKEEIAARDPDGFAVWQANFHTFTYPDGDSVQGFRQRVGSSWKLLAPTAPERVLLIAHRGVLLTIIADLLRLSDEQRAAWPADLGSIHMLTQAAGHWRASRVNQIDHLRDQG